VITVKGIAVLEDNSESHWGRISERVAPERVGKHFGAEYVEVSSDLEVGREIVLVVLCAVVAPSDPGEGQNCQAN